MRKAELSAQGVTPFESVREYVIGDPQKLVHVESIVPAQANSVVRRKWSDTRPVPWLLVVLDVNDQGL